METPHLYINQYVKTQSYLSYLIIIYVFQIKSSLFLSFAKGQVINYTLWLGFQNI